VSYLKVPGASLYFEVSGSGPVLLLIPGAPADAYDFVDLAPLLADRYTVVTYDWRGFSRSRLDGPPEDVPIEAQADDAHRLLQATDAEPAYVFGSSAGGLVGLALLARHPEQVHTLVAHEPPAVALLRGGDRRRALGQQVDATYRQHGAGPAMQVFAAGLGLGGGQPPGGWGSPGEPSPQMRQVMARMGHKLARMQPNVEFFLCHVLRSIGEVPDTATPHAASSRVVVAVGEASAGQLAHDTGLALAQRLGTPAVAFPGGHAGFLTHPAAFAHKLHAVLHADDPSAARRHNGQARKAPT
jgi:pimeloyl-ACP methyl ester carboxylesterase